MLEHGTQIDPEEIKDKKSQIHLWEKIIDIFGMEISNESRLNLQSADQRLLTGPLVVYINHVSWKDAAIMIPLVASFNNVKKVMGPVSMKQYDWFRNPVTAGLYRIIKPLGIYGIPVVQSKPDEIARYSTKKREKLLESLKVETERLMWRPGTVYGIAPDGTRIPGGQLKRAKPGFGLLEKYSRPPIQVSYLPVVLVYPHMSKEPEMIVEKPFYLSEIIPENAQFSSDEREKGQQTADILMLMLARNLTVNLRGSYASEEPYFQKIGIENLNQI